jgi:hypothetical protein
MAGEEAIAAIVTAVATMILALATLYQAVRTGNMVVELQDSRKTEFMPHVRIFLYMAQITIASLKIQNVGKGPAFDVDLKVTFKKSGAVVDERPFKPKVMVSQEDFELILPEMQLDKMLNSFTHVQIVGNYLDVFKTQFKVDESIDVKEFVENVGKAHILWRSKDGSLKPASSFFS